MSAEQKEGKEKGRARKSGMKKTAYKRDRETAQPWTEMHSILWRQAEKRSSLAEAPDKFVHIGASTRERRCADAGGEKFAWGGENIDCNGIFFLRWLPFNVTAALVYERRSSSWNHLYAATRARARFDYTDCTDEAV